MGSCLCVTGEALKAQEANLAQDGTAPPPYSAALLCWVMFLCLEKPRTQVAGPSRNTQLTRSHRKLPIDPCLGSIHSVNPFYLQDWTGVSGGEEILTPRLLIDRQQVWRPQGQMPEASLPGTWSRGRVISALLTWAL